MQDWEEPHPGQRYRPPVAEANLNMQPHRPTAPPHLNSNSRRPHRPHRSRVLPGHLRQLVSLCPVYRLVLRGAEILRGIPACDFEPALRFSSAEPVAPTVRTQVHSLPGGDGWMEMEGGISARSMSEVDKSAAPTASCSSGESCWGGSNRLDDVFRAAVQDDEYANNDHDIHGWEAEFDKRMGDLASCEQEISARRTLWRRLFNFLPGASNSIP